MTVKYICDGCGKESFGECNGLDTFKPRSWFARIEGKKELHACCRECTDRANHNSNNPKPIIPI